MTDASFFAPGRVNLIGEHLDYNGGRCLPIALSVGTTVHARRAKGFTFRSSQAQPGWTAYVEGVLTALGLDLPGLELDVESTVPVGAGLSSSAALTCSVALAALWAAGREPDPEVVIAAARRAEALAGAPTGGMDQTVSVLAREGHALLLDFTTGAREHVPWRHELLVIDTRARHALNDGRYAERRAQCEAAAQAGWAPLDGVLAKRARHVLTEAARVDQVLMGDVGPAFTASHVSLRDDFEVSCPELDLAVEAALEAGSPGARMTGGGFGGSAIALVDVSTRDAVRAAVEDAFGRRGWAAPGFLDGRASSGALGRQRGGV